MTKDEKQKEKFQKWRMRLDKMEFKISESIFKMTSQRRKLWRACPHKWENSMDKKHPGREDGERDGFRICEICGAIRAANINDRCMERL